MTLEDIEAAIRKHGTKTLAAKSFGMNRMQLTRKIASLQKQKAPKSQSVGFTRDDFRSKYDKSFIVPRRIKEALQKLGPTRYLPEADFTRLAGISQTDMAAYRALFEDDYVVVVERTKRLWCGSKTLASEFRGEQHG
jgi:hypothetical protein